MCIKVPAKSEPGVENAPRPDVGDEDFVVAEIERYSKLYYKLERFGKKIGFDSKCFATLPDATTDELEEETKEAIVPCPTY